MGNLFSLAGSIICSFRWLQKREKYHPNGRKIIIFKKFAQMRGLRPQDCDMLSLHQFAQHDAQMPKFSNIKLIFGSSPPPISKIVVA